MQKSKVEGSSASNSASKSSLLQQLGLVPAGDNNSTTTGLLPCIEEKSDNQTEGEKKETKSNANADPFLPVDRPLQKNKKKCWLCKTKLELAQRELGSCKCGKLGRKVLDYCKQ